MNKIIRLSVIFALIWCSLPLLARDFKYTYKGQTLTYTVLDEEAKTVQTKDGDEDYLRPGNNVSGKLIIPETVLDGDIEYSVTSIGGMAFYGRSGLTSVSIPATVTSIGNSAFSGCSGLTSVTIPSSLTSIGNSAFNGCSRLTSVTIPNSVTSIGHYAFDGCSGLTSVAIPNSVTYLGKDVFEGCTNLIKSAYPDNLKNPFPKGISIPYNAQTVMYEDGCIYEPGSTFLFAPNSLTGEYTVPNTVTSIGDNAFYGCKSLTSVTISNSIIKIGLDAFSGCSNISSLSIGTGLLEINKSDNCNPIKVIWQCNTPPKGYEYFTGKINYVANDSYDFENMVIYPLLSSVFESEGVIYVPVNPSQRTCDIIDCSYSDKTKELVLKGETTYKGTKMSVAKMNPYSFYNNDYIEHLNISFSGEIPEYAFYDCKNIDEIIIPNTISNIKPYSFYGCGSIKEISLNNTGSIDNNAFQNSCTQYAATLVVSSNVLDIGNEAFMDCRALSDIQLNNSGSIGVSAFEGSALYSPSKLSIGETVGKIGSKAFFGCKGLSEITLNNSGYIGDNAFQNSMSRNSAELTIAKSITSIGNSAFSNCSSLQTAEINNGGSIGNYAFNNCSSLQTAEINNGGSIGSYAFYGCSLLNEINIRSVGTVGEYAFAGCQAAEALKVAPTVTSLGNYAFKDCSSLRDVTIEEYNPYGTDDIKPEYQILVLGSNGSNSLFSDCPLDEVFIGKKLSYKTSSGSGYSPFYRNTSLRSVEISDVETIIYDNEFYGCTNLQSVKIGDGVKSFGKYSFSGCSKIDSFEFGRSVTNIGEEAFSDCTSMTNLTSYNPIPPVCGSQALDDINKWTCTLHVPTDALEAYMGAEQWNNFFFVEPDMDSNKYFEYRGLYYRATDLDYLKCEVVAQEDVPAEIMEAAILSADTMVVLEIPDKVFYKGVAYSVAGIGDKAFSTFTDLREVVIPETMEYIGSEAFANCPLVKVEVKAIIPPAAQEDSFDAEVYASAELMIPDESKNAYRTAAVWKNFTISPTLAASITLDHNEKTLKVGETFTLTATVLPEDTTDKTVTWTSSDEAVAIVDADGKVTALAPGEAEIMAKCGDVSATCKVSVLPVLVEFITISPDAWSGAVGDCIQLEATVLPEDATDKSLNWTSSDEMVATVDNTGLVSIQAEGTCVITATANDGSGVEAQCIINGLVTGLDTIYANGDASVDVYNTRGILLKKGCDKEQLQRLTPGIYILRNGEKVAKVIVK